MRLAFPHESSSKRLNTSHRDGWLQCKQMRGEAVGGRSPCRDEYTQRQDGGWLVLLVMAAQGGRALGGSLSEHQ